MARIKVFLDTDVVISALLSQRGASYQIISNPKLELEKIISLSLKKEVRGVSKRHKINRTDVEKLLKNIKTATLKSSKKRLAKSYSSYVLDIMDSHVVWGAHGSLSKFLLTHNLRHYLVDKIENDLGIIVMKPGKFLQFLRSN